MGYGYYVLADGREAGYGVEATCDLPGCAAKINRGLGYLCGRDPGGDENCCGDYFCGEHLHFGADGVQMCAACIAAEDARNAAVPTPGQQADEDRAAQGAEDVRREEADDRARE